MRNFGALSSADRPRWRHRRHLGIDCMKAICAGYNQFSTARPSAVARRAETRGTTQGRAAVARHQCPSNLTISSRSKQAAPASQRASASRSRNGSSFRLGIRRSVKDGRRSSCSIPDGLALQRLCNCTIEPDILREDEPAAAPDAPAIAEAAGLQHLAHCASSEDDAFRRKQNRVFLHLDCSSRAAGRRTGEQNRLLRQKGEPASCSDRQMRVDQRLGSLRTVDFLRRLRGEQDA